MDKPYRNMLAKVVGDTCGSLACTSIGFATFVVTLSLTLLYYNVEAWSVISIMVGIALACIFTRLSLFLSHCQDCKPDDVFKPVAKYMILFGVLGIALGCMLPLTYNAPYPNLMCYEVAIGIEVGHSEEAKAQCDEYRNSVQQLLDGTLMVFPIAMVVGFISRIMYRVSRFSSIE